MDICATTRRVQQLLRLEFKAWDMANHERDERRKARLSALSQKAHVKADALQHRLIAQGHEPAMA
jgi:hypothetical protein